MKIQGTFFLIDFVILYNASSAENKHSKTKII